uniref:SHSP domain-containing protein n=1 Tax=Syphacia muris TaxID=451379 RepID=A0A0N5A7J9_9BILA
MSKTINVELPGNIKQAEQWDWPLNKNDGMVSLVNTKEKFEVVLEVASFLPKEIEVKVVGEQLVIRCHHESHTKEIGDTKREVNRTYNIPQDVDIKTIESSLNSKGHLIITGSKRI